MHFLKEIKRRNNLGHAYLFSGQEKIGKKKAALEWLSLILGPLSNHPDFVLIEPIKKEIQISQIRRLTGQLSLKPSLSLVKAALIDNAHLMNQEAQTALLKTLEEPKGRTLIVLISHRPEELLLTILSRLQKIKFNSVKKQAIKEYLLKHNIAEKEREEICSIARGRPGLVMEIMQERKKLENFRQKVQELKQLIQMPLCARFQYVKETAEDLEKTNDILDIWLECFRKDLLSRCGVAFAASPSFTGYSNQQLKEIIVLIEKIKLLIQKTNINTKLALERLVLEI